MSIFFTTILWYLEETKADNINQAINNTDQKNSIKAFRIIWNLSI